MNDLMNSIIEISNNNRTPYRERQQFQLQNLRHPTPPSQSPSPSFILQNRTTTTFEPLRNEILYNTNTLEQFNDESENMYNAHYNTINNDGYLYAELDININNTTNTISTEPVFSVPLVQNQRFRQELNEYMNLDLVVGSDEQDQEEYYNEIFRLQPNSIINVEILQQSIEDMGGQCENDDDEINAIKTKINYDTYLNIKSEVKNDICPISLCELSDDDEVIVIKYCKHCISKDFEEPFLKSCTKCPLCNYKLLL